EDRDIDHGSAKDQRRKQDQARKGPLDSEFGGAVGDDGDAGDDLLKRLQPEVLEQHLEQRVHGPQQHAVEFPLDDINVSELVEADDVEQPQRNQREAVDEQDFVEAPAAQVRDAREEHDHEAVTRHRRQDARRQGDQKVGLVGQSGLGVLPEVLPEEDKQPAHLG